ncbi:ATP-binding protein [Actinoplanes couchii]|uniref:Transcriptional regulator n=1 Tax=Actinoplanes couchii TaxID=403638 RepID=A0ABQ3X7X0_9ACTN|nr:LuxR family transcriptional regulator [Actinoplanes couchii]MDR6320382.1 DNA-binding CsgD family transcriptional regulator/predicted transcriptional regulator [Actinoplanes couchii]GID54606.1 transcriptional regulator [Actinoplanes couchii]
MPSESLTGRVHEQRRIRELLSDAREGRGAALVLRGEAGIGKSALLSYAERAVPSLRVLRAYGSEFEQELPYSGLHQLCRPMLRYLPSLPARHGDALGVAFGLAEGAPDPYRIGLAVLELVTAAASEQPLLCLVDDAQWVDGASSRALRFLARRVAGDPIAILFAVRTGAPPDSFAELPGLVLSGLSDDEARALLAARSPFPLDDQVRDRLIAEARGSPLALLELPRAGGYVPPAPSSVPSRIEHGFQTRLDGLSAEARLLLITASADPTGDPGLPWTAALHLGLDLTITGSEAAGTGLAEFGHRIRFCHPLARSAVYRAATPGERHLVHRALAEATDPATAPDRRAWHRAHASAGPDDRVAAELEQCASRAQDRGGIAAAAAFLEQAVALSLNADQRITRTLAAAQAHFDAGTSETTAELLATLDSTGMGVHQRARVDQMRGRIAFTRDHDDAGPLLMVRAAQRLAPVDRAAARGCFLDALEMSLVVGRGGGVIRQVVAAARETLPPPASRTASSAPDLLDTVIALVTGGFAEAAKWTADEWTEHPALSTMIAIELWDPDTHADIADWLVKVGRDAGSPLTLRLGLAQKAVAATMNGDLGQAITVTAEEAAIADATDAVPLLHHRLHLAAQRGRRDEFTALAFTGPTRAAAARVMNLHSSAATLYNGLADYPAALAAARRATATADAFLTGAALPELVEAAIRCEEPAVAVEALEALTARTEASGTTAGRGMAAYARGLVTGTEDDFRQSIELLTEGPLTPYLGRAHLLYGEWLRRNARRRDCRPHLRTAHELLTASGSEGFAKRAADELRATGEKVFSRPGDPFESLTMQEVAIARLVGAGATSLEVAAQLFLSKRTVDAHLRNIFRKLGLTSRRQLKNHPGL